MKNYFKNTINVIENINIKYFIGADSLVGLNENDLFKYSKDLKVYFYEFNFFKMIK